MPIISDFNKSDKLLKDKIDSFSKKLELKSFFLLIKPDENTFSNIVESELIEKRIEKLIKAGLTNLEVSWSLNKNWVDFVSKIKIKFPKLNLGSASILSKKSIDVSVKIGLEYSMMKFWDKDLINYAKTKNHLLIPGIQKIKDLKEAIDLNCKIIKIYPAKHIDKLINISEYENINFIAAGGLSISDLQLYKSLGYKAIVIGNKGFKNKDIDPKIFDWLNDKSY